MKRIFSLVLVFSGILWAALLAQACVKEPTAAFTPSKTDVEIGESVTFTNRSVGATMYFWDFGDGLSSTEVTPCRSYNAAGSYTVSLTARSACGVTNEASALITVNAGGGDSGDGDDTGGGGDAEQHDAPTVTTNAVTNIKATSAICGGNVTDDGGAPVTARGVCWSTSQNPTVAGSHTTNGGGTGVFTSHITGLQRSKTYYVRAYATNATGTSYGAQRSFTTRNGVASVTTNTVSSITCNTAVCGGNVTDDGGAPVTARGVCWSTSQNPTVAGSHTTNGSGTGSFTSNITSLQPSTTYYVRAYATNAFGTSYGMRRSFTTTAIVNQSQTFTVGGVTFSMKPVSGGTFYMGAQSTNSGGQNYDADAYSNESPVHQVTLSSYYMGETEVTQALWYAVMGQRPTSGGPQWSSSYGIGNNYPAYYICWNDIQSFLTALNAATASQRGNKTFAMPTEAQWEFAARGGNSSHGYKYAGSNTVGNVAWYTDNSGGKTHPVKGKSPNELGLYDMSGNVYEWCKDWYNSSYYSSSPSSNPTGPSSGSNRVLRGGSWIINAGGCRVSYRISGNPVYRNIYYGFRLVLLP